MRTLAFRHGHPVSRGRDGCWLRVEGEREGPLRCHHRPCCHCSVPPTPPLTTQIPTRVRWMAGQVDLTAQVSPIAKEEISRTVSRTVIELLLLRGI